MRCEHAAQGLLDSVPATDVSTQDAEIDALLDCQNWVVVGLRDDASRPAWRVAKFLVEHGKSLYPVHPHPEAVHGVPGYVSVAQACAAIVSDHGADALASTVVDCFVNSERVGAVADEAVAAGVCGVWMQLGVVDESAAQRARAAGLVVVMDRCPAIEIPARTH